MATKKPMYHNRKNFRFYALTIEDDGLRIIFIGKTGGQRLSAVLSRHVCGKVDATVDFFSKNNRPHMHLLSEHTVTTAQAYKYVVAYVNFFTNAGYVCINHDATITHAEDPKPETLAIIQSLERETAENLLARTLLDNPSSADRKRIVDPPVQIDPVTQMNVRIKQSDKELFDQFRSAHGLNQQEAFRLLLDQASEKHYNDLLFKKEAKILKLEKENEALQSKLSARTTPPIPKVESNARNFLKYAKQCYCEYTSLMIPPPNAQPLPHQSYKKFTKRFHIGAPYEYPAAEGCTVLYLERILWGNDKTHAAFLLGTTPEGKRIKLRYYSKELQFLMSPLSSPLAYVGAAWFVGYRPAIDQALELVLAFPLCHAQTTGIPDESSIEKISPQKKPSLEELIANATK